MKHWRRHKRAHKVDGSNIHVVHESAFFGEVIVAMLSGEMRCPLFTGRKVGLVRKLLEFLLEAKGMRDMIF